MSLSRRIERWTARGLRALVLSAALGAPAAVAAQAPGGALPDVSYTKNAEFELPVRMDDAMRSSLREVRLYVKTPSTGWTLHKSGPPSLTRFQYRVPADGEYWFALTTVDRAGKMTPRDPAAEPPSLRVLVDTQPPTLLVRPWSEKGEVGLRCSVEDSHAAPDALKAVCRTPAGDVPLEPVVGQPGTFRLRGADALAHPVRVSAADRAGNVASRDINVKELFAAAGVAAPNALPGGVTNTSARVEPRRGLPEKGVAPAGSGPNGKAPLPLPPEVTKVGTPTAHPPIVPASGQTLKSTETPKRLPGSLPDVPSALPPAATPAVTGGASAGAVSNRRLLNTTRASVDYRIDQVGPSGVGKVEVYLTTDGGQSWHRLREDPSRRSPTEIDLPGEGVFGIHLAITNGNGFGGRPPARGDAPDCTIEVDTTPPFVQLRPSELVPQTGQLEVRWTASDKNLGAEPVSLSYRTRPDGPWQVIAKGVKNTGSHRWTFPRDAGATFYVRIEATDQAGNVAHVDSPSPITLDITEPRASVINVSGAAARPGTTPRGN